MKHKLEPRLLGEISITSETQMTPPFGRNWRVTKKPLDESERREWKSWLKTQHSKTKIMASSPITSWQIDEETVETVSDFILFSSVTQSCSTLCDPMDCSTPGFPVHHQLPELVQTHVHRVGDEIQWYPPSSPSPPALNLSQHQGLFQWVSSSYQVVKVLELQLQHQSFQWIFRTDFL